MDAPWAFKVGSENIKWRHRKQQNTTTSTSLPETTQHKFHKFQVTWYVPGFSNAEAHSGPDTPRNQKSGHRRFPAVLSSEFYLCWKHPAKAKTAKNKIVYRKNSLASPRVQTKFQLQTVIIRKIMPMFLTLPPGAQGKSPVGLTYYINLWSQLYYVWIAM